MSYVCSSFRMTSHFVLFISMAHFNDSQERNFNNLQVRNMSLYHLSLSNVYLFQV